MELINSALDAVDSVLKFGHEYALQEKSLWPVVSPNHFKRIT